VSAASTWLFLGTHAFDWSLGLTGGGSSTQHATDELTDDTFDKYMKDHPVTAILFYAPWCFYSQQVMPAWDLAGQKLKIHDPPVTLAKIDAHRFGSVGDRYGVNAFPSMKLFVDGTVFEYDSSQGRGWQQIVKWVNKHIDRDHVLKSVEDVDHYLNDNDLNVIGLFGDNRNHSVFTKSSRHFEDISFAESREMEQSQKIAEHLAKHATLICETIDVGQSTGKVKEVPLPRANMHCTDQPRNPQRPEWTDKYKATAEGEKLKVERADKDDGWQQMLQIRCCDQETPDHKSNAHEIPVPSVVMFMPHDERFARYEGDLEDVHALDKWISARRAPMVMHLNGNTAEKIMDSGPDKAPVLFLITNTAGDEIEKEVRDAAKQLRGRVLVAISGTNSPIEKRLTEMAGVDEESLPVVTLIEARGDAGENYHSSKKYRLPTAGLKAKDVVQFVTDFENKKLQPWLKSEPIPSKSEQGPVQVLVGLNFREVSQDPETDVLIDFYAPWCGHCRKFEPNYKTIAKKLKHIKTLKIMKLDATRNEVEGMSIMGFPTIVLFPAGKSPKRQIMYQGNRQPDDMVRWLHDHCNIKFDDRPPAQPVTAEPVSGLLDEAEEADL
jgi:protein disulfide-isomerase A1